MPKNFLTLLLISFYCYCLLISHSAFSARAIHFDGTTEINIPQNKAPQALSSRSKTVSVMNLKLSKEIKVLLARRSQKQSTLQYYFQKKSTLPPKVNLGMNHIPVLDQGRHGTCATFASIAAIDAGLGRGDYASPLCHLTLGSYLANNSYVTSGWDGTFSESVLSQAFNYGIINTVKEKEGCGGLTSYPTEQRYEEGQAMTLEEFHNKSEDLNEYLAWAPISTLEDVLLKEYNADEVLYKIKEALANHHRVVIGVLLDTNVGHAGATASYKALWPHDTWVITPEIQEDLDNELIEAGHALVIYGYDDNAIAKDEKNNEYKGLFLLRNSWGKHAGYHGNYFMTYDYLQKMILESHKIYSME